MNLEKKILDLVRRPGYAPMKLKALARRLKIASADYQQLEQVIATLADRGDLYFDDRRLVLPAQSRNEWEGVFKKLKFGGGIVRILMKSGNPPIEIRVFPENALDAANGDLVRVTLIKSARRTSRSGRIIRVVQRSVKQFVGLLFEKDRELFVQVDGTGFAEPIFVSRSAVLDAMPGDKVVMEMVRYPNARQFGEGEVVEILGRAGEGDVEAIAVIRQYELPDEFTPEVLAAAKEVVHQFYRTTNSGENGSTVPADRMDLTSERILTIDPVDAKDFDDAVSLSKDERGHWRLGVHIADVAEFVILGGPIDRAARERGTSVYLPGKVLPMLPEDVSNDLASLREGQLRLTKSVFVEIDPTGRILSTEFANSAIRVAQRLTYGQVQSLFDAEDTANKPAGKTAAGPTAVDDDAVVAGEKTLFGIAGPNAELLLTMRGLANVLRGRRRKRGMLELSMPEAVLEYNQQGEVAGCRYTLQSESQRLIEEFMLTANEAAAAKLESAGTAFLRRIHPPPNPDRLKLFADFVRSLDITVDDEQSRFELQKIVARTTGDPRQAAVHYALLRSMREAVYAPDNEGHYALASECYCHFTSPIRRYPDLHVHRLLDRLIRTGSVKGDEADIRTLGEHCSLTERRAAKAERELVKVKLLQHMATRVGEQVEMVVVGVEEIGLFCQGVETPAEGLLHVRRLPADQYTFDRSTQSLAGRQQANRFRLGDRIVCRISRVDLPRRRLDIELASHQPATFPADVLSDGFSTKFGQKKKAGKSTRPKAKRTAEKKGGKKSAKKRRKK